jgi:hypothetical protein
MNRYFFDLKTNARAGFFAPITLALITLALSACGDPGSGGSGLPGSTGAGSSTFIASPSVSGSLSSVVAIEALDASSLSIAGVRYALSQIDLFLSDGSSTTAASLSVGLRVTITLTQDTPSQRWRLQLTGTP